MKTLILTRVQKRVYDEVHRMTKGGKEPWVGRIELPDVARGTANTAISALHKLGAIKAERHSRRKPWRFELRVPRNQVKIGSPRDVMRAREKASKWGSHTDRPVQLDSGAFLEALRRAAA